MSVRLRLALLYVVAIAVMLGLVGILVWWQLRSALRSSLDQTLQTRAVAVATSLENNGQSGLQELDATGPPGFFVAIFDGTGRTIDATAGVPAGLGPPPAEVGTADITLGTTTYATYAIAGAGGAMIIAGSSLAAIGATLEQLARSLMAVGVVAALASLAGGWWLAGRALRPVSLIIAEASHISAADIQRRLPVPRRHDELWALATTLNGMLDRVAGALSRQRSFVAAASHDLRSPIAALQAELELAEDPRTTDQELRDALRAAHADTLRLGALANGLLDLATVDVDGRALVRSTVRIDSLIESVAHRLEPLARERDAAIVSNAPSQRVRVDRVRLEQALSNLIVNAISYGPAGGSVEVRAMLDSTENAPPGGDGSVLTIEVLDRGPGMPAEVAAAPFEPFRRGPNAVGPGAGLGLATAAAAIRAHHGTIGFEPRSGGGTRSWLRLPM